MWEALGLVLYGELRLVLLTQATLVINGAYTFGLTLLCEICNSKAITNETSLAESLREWICAVLQNVASYSSCLWSYCVVYFVMYVHFCKGIRV